MKMNTILALAAVAIASVASASTNYVEVAKKNWSLVTTVRQMAKDPELADPSAFRKTLEAVDKALATQSVNRACQHVSRKLPLTARAVFARLKFTDTAREDALALCGYDADNRTADLKPGDAGYANFALQAAASGYVSAASARSGVLSAAIVPTRRTIRHEGGTFVGKEGGERVKAILDALANELNSPRFGNAGELLAEIGIEVEWEFIQSTILKDEQIATLNARLLDGEIPFGPSLQNKLCVALGVDAYNDFVSEYNGK